MIKEVIDQHGRPTNDPGVVVVPQANGAGGGLFGALMPFGEHKGYGLAVACELLGGALTGTGADATGGAEPSGLRALPPGRATPRPAAASRTP